MLWPRPLAPWISSQLCKRFEATTHLEALPDAFSAGEQITIISLHQFNHRQSFGGISIALTRRKLLAIFYSISR